EDVTGLGYWSRDVNAAVADWSPGMFRLFDLDPATFVPGRDAIRAQVLPDDLAVFDRMTAPPGPDDSGRDGELRMFCGDGSIKDVLAVIRFRRNRTGAIREVFGILVDITARKAANRLVALREEQLQSAVAAMGAAVWERDLASDTLTTGERWIEMLGRDP